MTASGCRWPGCPSPTERGSERPWCSRHDDYWAPHRWPPDGSGRRAAELAALSHEELVAHCERLLAGPMPIQGMYRLMMTMGRLSDRQP